MVSNLSHKIHQEIIEIAIRYPVQKIVLFGSRARGDNKRTSDIDLAVFPLPNFNQKGHLTRDLDDINTLLKIDIVLVDEKTGSRLRNAVESEGITIYECSEN